MMLMKHAHYHAALPQKLAELDEYHHDNLSLLTSIAGGGVACLCCGRLCVDKRKVREIPKVVSHPGLLQALYQVLQDLRGCHSNPIQSSASLDRVRTP